MNDVSSTARQISFLIFPDALLLDFAGPLQVFELAGETSSVLPYRLRVASTTGGLIRTSSGVQIMTESLETIGLSDTIVLAGGPGAETAARDLKLTAWLKDRAPSARRVCSVCTGAFVLATAELLEGRRVVTHWGSCSLLQEQHPGTTVAPDAIYVKDGAVWTSAGATAGIDMALAMVQEDLGHREAIRVARRLVVFLKRAGGQTQFSVPLGLQAQDEGEFDSLHDWMQGHLGDDLRVDALAARVGMSPRTFARRYTQLVGRTPAKSVEELRLEAARRALEETGLTLKQVAIRCGFLDEERMRRSFQRRLGVCPQDYQQRFCSSDPAGWRGARP